MVQLRELGNDNDLHSKLAPLLPLSAVRNHDRQDVDSVMEISSPSVRKIFTENAKTQVTHTVVPEKYRLREDNKRGDFKAPIGTCMGPLGHIFVSDVVQGKIYKVRANHYPANVTVEWITWNILLELLFSRTYCIVQSPNGMQLRSKT